jgi:hypothetical protein
LAGSQFAVEMLQEGGLPLHAIQTLVARIARRVRGVNENDEL